MAIKIFYN